MSLYQNKYRIESTRRVGYDYSTPGYYFFTIATKNRGNLLGQVEAVNSNLNDIDKEVSKEKRERKE